jgi:hypothetical protein
MALAASWAATGHAATPAAAPAPEAAIDPATVPMPNLTFTPDAEVVRNYGKYFFFHREGTDFATAYADLRECDGYARGLAFRVGGASYMPVPAGLAGGIGAGIGGAVGSALADAIFGSAERRLQRRIIMRTCMGYKAYSTFGLPRDQWLLFNFDEGNKSPPEEVRQHMLLRQARAASGPRPQIGEMRR